MSAITSCASLPEIVDEVKKRATKKLAAQYLLLRKINNILDQFNVNGIHTFFTFLQVKFYTVAFFNVVD